MTVYCQPPDPNPRPPAFAIPPGATDCHAHIFGPEQQYPTSLEHALSATGVPDALPAAARHLYQVLGIQRAVLVQASKYGLDLSLIHI